MDWRDWWTANWAALVRGAKLEAPRWLPAPVQAGFRAQYFATPEGQAADWTLSLNDRSRLHIHELADGRRFVHRDRHDPDQGIGDLIAHLTKETRFGPVLVVGGLVMLTYWLTKK